ncbi:NAD(P)-dependent dehydrogenase (short-subunit alcohol dehydrogenase family) [Loktanella ponticola]|uniref:NAD(P)-dependent dehydrogenase (Short-subunit alcohol dehydrogenase family) n=1 Tax=Yoonia ponticola TaxID=1524255 RepID=A0A7W9BH41_9RHOB|nr:SDR family oxidoreductase [Yoonia ponticola]MBB5720448.1 NAD(P)-dependent dehydrogenase (short-subunit alcohol dehydrogenase family) [Yoonia ponticola]
MNDQTLRGKTVLITGASRGIGAAAAHAFADAGANVVLAARSRTEIEAIASGIGDRALAVECDVSDPVAVEAAVSTTIAHFGAIDVFVGNAGTIDPISNLSEANPDAFSKAIDVNFKGVFYGMRAALPPMIAQRSGTIITVSSGAAHNPVLGWSAYCSSKAGAYMLTRTADLENRDHGIRVLGLSPGTVATQMQREIKASGVNAVSELDWSDHIPPKWAAKALVWMCGDAADPHLGADVSLRDDDIRRQIGLI